MEETNTFSPVICGKENFDNSSSSRGLDVIERNTNAQTAVSGMLDVIRKYGDEVVPVVDLNAQSSGPVSREFVESFVDEVVQNIDLHAPVGAVFLSLHGGMTLSDDDDGCGFILEHIRRKVGTDVVIAVSTDLHANITRKILSCADAIAGYQTYPHEDYRSTGQRAAELGYRRLRGEHFVQACIRIPMIVPAETYDTSSGPFAELIMDAHKLKTEGRIMDFSIYMMQPWLNVADAGSSVLITASDKLTADRTTREFARRLHAMRHQLKLKLWSVEEIVDIAESNDTGMPVILVDSADSPNAGSAADSSEVLRLLKERGCVLRAALSMNDAPAVEKAFKLGVGAEAPFTLGGTLDRNFQRPYTIHAYVKSLHDGDYLLEGPAMRGEAVSAGKSAVIRSGNIDIVLFHHMPFTGDPQLYRAFGIEPTLYRLVMVKSATQYKAAYKKFTTLFYPADTPGSSTANLTALPFDKLPRPFWPFDDVGEFDETPLYVGVGPGL